MQKSKEEITDRISEIDKALKYESDYQLSIGKTFMSRDDQKKVYSLNNEKAELQKALNE